MIKSWFINSYAVTKSLFNKNINKELTKKRSLIQASFSLQWTCIFISSNLCYRLTLTPGLIDDERLIFWMNVPFADDGFAFLIVSSRFAKFSISF